MPTNRHAIGDNTQSYLFLLPKTFPQHFDGAEQHNTTLGPIYKPRPCQSTTSPHFHMASRPLLTRLPRPFSKRILAASAPPFSATKLGVSLPRSRYFAYPMAPLSTLPEGKWEWLVVVPDKAGVHEKRLSVRAQHLAGTKPLEASGFIKAGGAIFNEKPESQDATKFSFYGSTLVCVASSKEEILEILNKDIYATSGVWDMDNIQIWPAKFAFRNP
ncbi:hypothetical protein RRF57_004517 [Xylaria bambusicola]|uniref:YCII-related domain-containing protein n=1 Tax=Xylaria bambusicola TaxID=326684 RepID=A0AAN7Z3Y2_9PEZI